MSDQPAQESASRAPGGDVAIEVRDLDKSFHIPTERVSRLKERLVNPFARQDFRVLRALREVSFDVGRGEFFGIVGRNGSGKSTLLKIMAGIYAADSGGVRVAGRVAPFIELGVGFDMELTARENIVLNGVMMGMSPAEARRRLDGILEFGELEDFVDLRLKNYSSGMLVRLAFSIMVEADTDILLIDEVLAVGDAAFQQKCADVFHEMRDGGKTVVLVTHDMRAVEEFCHRALLLNNGDIVEIGDPTEVARRYLRLNFEEMAARSDGAVAWSEDLRILDVWLEDGQGKRVTNLERGQPIRLRLRLEALQPVEDPLFGLAIANQNDLPIYEFAEPLPEKMGQALRPGQRVTISIDAENSLAPGHYYLHHGISRKRTPGDAALFAPRLLGFVVYGTTESNAAVDVRHEMTVVPDQ